MQRINAMKDLINSISKMINNFLSTKYTHSYCTNLKLSILYLSMISDSSVNLVDLGCYNLPYFSTVRIRLAKLFCLGSFHSGGINCRNQTSNVQLDLCANLLLDLWIMISVASRIKYDLLVRYKVSCSAHCCFQKLKNGLVA